MTTTKETKWVITQDGVENEVNLERWVWRAHMKDGSIVYQFEPTEFEEGKSRFHQIGELDMSQVEIFEMVSTEDPSKRYSIVTGPDIEKFIVFIRRTVLEATTANEQRINVYCFGYVIKGVSVYNFILPDDRLVTSLDRNLKLITAQ